MIRCDFGSLAGCNLLVFIGFIMQQNHQQNCSNLLCSWVARIFCFDDATDRRIQNFIDVVVVFVRTHCCLAVTNIISISVCNSVTSFSLFALLLFFFCIALCSGWIEIPSPTITIVFDAILKHIHHYRLGVYVIGCVPNCSHSINTGKCAAINTYVDHGRTSRSSTSKRQSRNRWISICYQNCAQYCDQ